MSASSSQQSTKATGQLEIQVDAGEGDQRKLGTTKDPGISNILKNITGDEAMRKLVQSVAEIIVKLAKDNEEHTVAQNVCDQEIEEKHPEIEEKRNMFVPFGPLYGPGSDSILMAKYRAWNHIVQKTGPKTERDYERSLMEIEVQAMETYGIPDNNQREAFREMMVMDGCFFLQLALHILGGQDLLNYPPDNPYFGNHVDSAIWIPDMFLVGNQIPYIVIRVLMKQTFFRDVIKNGIKSRTWCCPDERNIAEMALYLIVVKPELSSHVKENPPLRFSSLPHPNILDCLHNLFLGIRAHELKDSKLEVLDGSDAASNDHNIKIPSAVELSAFGIKLATNTTFQLSRSGIEVATNRRPRIKKICFRNIGYCAKIYLPTLTIHRYTKDIFMTLLKYEQNMKESDREVTAYLRFMRDLVRTQDDFKILEEKRIIEVKDEELKASIIHMLEDLATLHNSKFTLTFRHIRKRITEYDRIPWRLISFILGVLSFISTIFTVLAYVLPLK